MQTNDGRRPLPSNIEAEQMILGILLYQNDALHNLPPGFGLEHFYEPLHARLFDAISSAIHAGRRADPVLLAGRFERDPGLEEMGGPAYLATLYEKAPSPSVAAEFGQAIMDLATRRQLLRAADSFAELAWDQDTSPIDIVRQAEALVSAIGVQDKDFQLVSADAAITRVLERLDAPAEAIFGILTGLSPIDRALGPWSEGDLVLLGGRPSMGKSAIASVIAQNVARAGYGVIELNAEMTVEQMMRRHMASIAFELYSGQAPAYSAIRKREIEYAQRQMLDRSADIIRGLPLKALRRSGLTISQIRTICRRQFMAWKREGVTPGLVAIDHMGLVRADGRSRGRYEDQTQIAVDTKALAGDLGVPVLALVQLSRQVEARDDKRPTMGDFRDTGAWEENADVMIGVYRDAYYAQRETEPKDTGSTATSLAWADWDARRRSKTIEAILLKVREGDLATCRLWGDMRTNAILAAEPSNFGGMI